MTALNSEGADRLLRKSARADTASTVPGKGVASSKAFSAIECDESAYG